ncbi:hypothetical protein D3C73_1359940 [compost metagenome]
MFAAVDQIRHDRRISGHERGTVPGKVRLLAERVDTQQAIRGTTGNPGIQDAGDGFPAALGIPFAPAQLRVALVRGHDRSELTGLSYDPLE